MKKMKNEITLKETLTEYYNIEQELLKRKNLYYKLNEIERLGPQGRSLKNEIFGFECALKSFSNVLKRLKNIKN